MDIKKLATAPMSGFRHKLIPVPEWGPDVKVIIREPSAPDWVEWQSALKDKVIDSGEDAPDNETLEQTQTGVEVEALLFSSILLDTSFNRVFTKDDLNVLIPVYGPVHTRLLNQALHLGEVDQQPMVEAEKK